MRFLLDTHLLLWSLTDSPRLSREARRIVEDAEKALLFSAASIWEIAIKAGRRRADFTVDPLEIVREARAADMEELPVDSATAALVKDLPPHHRDPFDRLLVAQAISGGLRFCTVDRRLTRYSDLVCLVE